MFAQQLLFLQHALAHPSGAQAETCALPNGVRLELWDSGILRCVPAQQRAQYRVVISSGLHGNETAPIEIVDELVRELCQGAITPLNEILFIIGNPAAAKQAQRFVDDNMNRVFSGKHAQLGQSYEAQRAQAIETYVERFFAQDSLPRLHYDLHTAIRGSEFEKFVVYPYLASGNWSKPQLGFLEHCGIQAALLSNKPSGTFSYYTSNAFGAHSFTVELGSVKPFGDNDMSHFVEFQNGFRDLIQGREDFDRSPQQLEVFAVIEEVIKHTEQFELHFSDDAKNFTVCAPGTLLASDVDFKYITQRQGERFVFPIKNIPPGNRAMLVVAPTQL